MVIDFDVTELHLASFVFYFQKRKFLNNQHIVLIQKQVNKKQSHRLLRITRQTPENMTELMVQVPVKTSGMDEYLKSIKVEVHRHLMQATLNTRTKKEVQMRSKGEKLKRKKTDV